MPVLAESQQPAEPTAKRSAAPAIAPARRPGRRALVGPPPPRGMHRSIALSLLPAIALFVTFFLLPLIVLLGTSVAEWGGLGYEFIGLDNFTVLFADDTFWMAVRNTALYAAAGVLIQVPLGCLVGIILAQHVPGWQLFRTILFIPFVISGAAYAVVFALFYNPRYGLLNQALDLIGLNGGHDWLYSTSTALPAVTATFVFIVGFAVVLVMAEIASIPRELYEAAEIDGASVVQRQWHITRPLLRNVVGTLMLITLLGYLGLFDVVFILTSGGPNDSTVTLTLYAYRAYTNGAWGYANAVGIVIVIIGLLLIVGVRRAFRIGERSL